MEKKKSKGLIAVIIILLICIIGLVFYILVDKDIIKINNKIVENEQIEENNTDKEKEEEKGVSIDTTNENIINLFNNAHYLSIGIDTHIYRDGGYKVSEMSEEEKFTLSANQWSSLIEKEGTSSLDNVDWTLYLDEDTLKNVYERTFGPNTYKQINQITDGICTTLTYDSTNKRYSYTGKYGCGGTSAFGVHEKIINATKYSDRIEIVSAVIYLDGMSSQMYKDYNKTTSLGGLLVDSNNTNNEEERENTYNKYIEDNKDNLEQYTYTYTLNEDGFYYLTSVERTKS